MFFKIFLGEKRVTGGDLFIATIEKENFSEECIIKDNKDGTYGIFYNMQQEGHFVLNISCYGKPVKGSPFKLELFE